VSNLTKHLYAWLFHSSAMNMKRAEAGISVLIVFIAMILVAAVAAGVFITTANVLQQRSLATGNEAQERISRGMEIVEILGIQENNRVIGFEMLIRPLPSSSSLTQDSLFLQFSGSQWGHSAYVQNNFGEYYETTTGPVATVMPTSWPIHNVDEEGTAQDTLTYGVFTGGVYVPGLVLETDRGYRAELFLAGTQENVYYPLINTTVDQVFGYVRYSGDQYTLSSATSTCDFDTQMRNHRFCLEEVLGNGNQFIDRGEMWRLTYRLSEPQSLGEASPVSFRLVSSRGHVAQVSINLPQVFPQEVFRVWP